MSRDRGMRSRRRLSDVGRFALATASVTLLSLTTNGCVVVHGEREVVPAATRAEAARALEDFTTAYNKADQAYDRSLDEERVAGALADIDGAKLRAGRKINPRGNPAYSPLELTDATFTIPAKAGWPRWFLADTVANKGSQDNRWLLVFTRADASDVWVVSYLTIVAAKDVPEFTKDADGHAQPVKPSDKGLAVPPDELGEAYAEYLAADRDGGDGADGEKFAPGRHTSQWRADRAKNAVRPGLARQYADEPLSGGAYAPLGLRTTDGGALVFFATRHFEKQTAARGVDMVVEDPNIRALMTGEVKSTLTLEHVSNQAVLNPDGSGPARRVRFLSRVDGLTAAKGD